MPGLESDLIVLVKNVPAFLNPIMNFWSPAKVATDPLVVARFGYNRLPQNTQKPGAAADAAPPPFLTWKGPFAFDQGQTSPFALPDATIRGSSNTKKATFWFMLYHQTATDAVGWANDIKNAIDKLAMPNNLTTYRLTAALFKDMGSTPLDQTQITGKEYPTQCAFIGYEFGYQLK